MRSLRRKNRQVPVSFFAFQDIITALAGSMLIIVLVIAYGKSRAANTPGAATGSRSEYNQLQQKVLLQTQELEFKRALLQQQRQKQTTLRRSEALEQQQQKIKINLRQVQKSQQQLQKEYQLWLQKNSEQQKILSSSDPALKKLLESAVEVEQIKRQLRHKQYLLKIVPPDRKQTFLLECSRNCWLWSDHANRAIQLGKNDPTPTTALTELRQKLRAVVPEQSRLIIAIRPTAGGFAQALKDQLKEAFPAMEIICEPLIWENAGGFTL